ncbi:unnamed protein product [Linum trigynum]|uniref:RNase H type-1 domain-containing protein n=1 Tax=Linum trigynum TaxID=586398 RepID=A0AAV2CU67_9ROSI
MCSTGSSNQPRIWSHIWKLQVPERVRCFAWLVAHNRISCNEQRVKRHLSSSPFCYRCPLQVETPLHALRDCPPAAYTWSRLVPAERQFSFFSNSLEQWLSSNLKEEDKLGGDIPWNAYFSIGLWNLWKNRNDGAFNGIEKTLSPPSLLQATKIKADLWYKAWSAPRRVLGRRPVSLQRTPTEIGWSPPPAGWDKMNVDGAANGRQGPAGAGGILRNSEGRWIGGFVCSLGSCSAILAELWGIYHGLGVAWQQGSRALILETDSQMALQLIDKRTDPLHPHSTLLGAIRRRIARDWVVKLAHTYREGNRAADWLSKHSLVYPYGKLELTTPPQGIQHIIRDDCRGTTFTRSIVTAPHTHLAL